MAEVKIKNALHVPTGKTYNIIKAKNGKACECICFGCNKKLIAAQGDISAWHFRHETETDCNGAPETALHQLGKQIIVDKLQIHLPKYGLIQFSNAVAERELHSFRPDVTADYDGKKIFFEVAVTHFAESNKKQFFIEQGHRAVEINLGALPYDAPYEEVEEAVINNLGNKKILSWDAVEIAIAAPAKQMVLDMFDNQTIPSHDPAPSPIEGEPSDNNNSFGNIFKGVLLLGLFLIIRYLFKRIKSRRGHRRYKYA